MGYLFLLGRILYGGFFLYSGIKHFKNAQMMSGYAASRGVPMPKMAVIGSGLLIFLGGIGIILGIYIKISLILIILFLIPVTFTMHRFWEDADPNMKMTNKINFEKNLALLGAALILLTLPTVWILALMT